MFANHTPHQPQMCPVKDTIRHSCGQVRSAPQVSSPRSLSRATDETVAVIGRSDSRASRGCPHHSAKPRIQQAGGSCCVHSERDTPSDPGMVSNYEQAQQREFTVRHMLKKNRYVYNIREAPEEVMKMLVRQSGKCSNLNASVELSRKSIPAIRRELRKRLANALAAGTKEKAFAKQCGGDNRPRADELERLVAAYPGVVDWEAEPVQSGMNCDLWRAWHARHCEKCTATIVHRTCYFRLIDHFLRSGLQPPEDPAQASSLQSNNKRNRAYVNKWNKEKTRCRRAYDKWVQESEGLMSRQYDEEPEFYSPLLPVVRAKDKWRHARYGKEYKVRLCMDLKSSGYNDRLLDWPFRYRGLDAIAEEVNKGDWIAVLDISRFYLRLPGSVKLRAKQWFQDPDSYAGSTFDNNKISPAKLKFRQLLAVAFGVKSAPAWASLVSGELCRILQSFGVHVAGVYIDDILIRARTKEKCKQDMDVVARVAKALGIPLNEKTQGPAQKLPYLGVNIDTVDCVMTVTREHRLYAMSRLAEVLHQSTMTAKDMESLCGILTWIAFVFDPGRPRRNVMYRALARANKDGKEIEIRGELRAQLQWWLHALERNKVMASKFYTGQPDTPLVCSDASGDDGWGACVFGMHIVGPWPPHWRQSADSEVKPHMLYKELVPPVVTTLLLAPMLQAQVLCCALDNAGVAFSINRMSCGCERSLELMRPFADSVSRGQFSVIAGHAHRVHNSHTDALSHSLCDAVWTQVIKQARVRKTHRAELHFAVLDVKTRECYLATTSFTDPVLKRSINPDARGVKHGSSRGSR